MNRLKTPVHISHPPTSESMAVHTYATNYATSFGGNTFPVVIPLENERQRLGTSGSMTEVVLQFQSTISRADIH